MFRKWSPNKFKKRRCSGHGLSKLKRHEHVHNINGSYKAKTINNMFRDGSLKREPTYLGWWDKYLFGRLRLKHNFRRGETFPPGTLGIGDLFKRFQTLPTFQHISD